MPMATASFSGQCVMAGTTVTAMKMKRTAHHPLVSDASYCFKVLVLGAEMSPGRDENNMNYIILQVPVLTMTLFV